jgi:hypothetical protein
VERRGAAFPANDHGGGRRQVLGNGEQRNAGRRSLSNPMRHQAAWFLCDVTVVSMVAGGWLIQTLAGRGGGAGSRRNRLGLAA